MKNTLSAKVLQSIKIHQNKTSIKKKTLSRLTKAKITSTNNELKPVIINIKFIYRAKPWRKIEIRQTMKSVKMYSNGQEEL